MLMMKHPSFVINSCDVPGFQYRMNWWTINPQAGFTARELVNEITSADNMAKKSLNSPLLNVIINCHGSNAGGLAIGGKEFTHLDMKNVSLFILLAGRNIGTIWLVACEAAQGSQGKAFCQALAAISGCQVVAADEEQEVGVWGTYRLNMGAFNQIDEFEGNVYSFTPKGPMTVIDPHSDIYTILD
jgi:hypothetical protein